MDDLYDELSLRQDRNDTSSSHRQDSYLGNKRPPIKLLGEDGFDVNVNVLNGYTVNDVYCVDFNAQSLGDGGFGTVFQGSHLYEPDTPVAIKKVSFGIMRRRRYHTGHDTANELDDVGGADDEDTVYPDSAWSHHPSNGHDGSSASKAPNLRKLIASLENQIAEIGILKLFRNDYRVVHLHEYFISTEPNTRITSLYLVTEFLQGGELFDCIKARIIEHLKLDPVEQSRQQPFREGDVRDVFRTLLNAVQFMHRHCVLHRDLKPSNLLLQAKNVPTSLKVADFGQSKILKEGMTTRTSTGTPGYRPPEMYAGEPYGQSVDLFSAGCILFFLLAGYQPFASYPKHKIKSKTLRCEYRTNVDSWNRVSKPAKKLVKGLLATADRRLTLDEVLRHEWMCQDDGAEDLKKDLTENAKCLVMELDEEVTESRHEARANDEGDDAADVNASAQPSAHVMPNPLESRRSSAGIQRSAPSAAVDIFQQPSSILPPASIVTPDIQVSGESSQIKQVRFMHHAGISATQFQSPADGSCRSLPSYKPELVAAPPPLPPTAAPASSTPAPRRPASSASKSKSSSGGICDCLFGRTRRTADQEESTASDEDRERRGDASANMSVLTTDVLSAGETGSTNTAAAATREEITSSTSLSFVRDYSPLETVHARVRDLVHMGTDVPPDATPLLDSVTANFSPVDYTEAVARDYVRALFEAVLRLHTERIVHRNLSVSNVLINDLGQVIIKDMRFACETVLGQDRLSGYCGTPYIITAPEVYTDFSYCEKVDLWSLGIVTYLLLCGVFPFFGTGDEPELRRMGVEIYYPFSETAPSRAARDFVRLLLQPDPRNRPSAQAMLNHEWMQVDGEVLRGICLEFAFGGFSVPGGFD